MKLFTTRIFTQLIGGLLGGLFLYGLPTETYAQQAVTIARQYLTATATKQGLTPADVQESVVSSAYLSPTTGWYHVYFNQAVQSVEVHNRLMNVVLKNNLVQYVTNNYLPEALSVPREGDLKRAMAPLVAVQRATAYAGFSPAGLSQAQAVADVKLSDGTLTKQLYKIPALSNDNVEVKLHWLPQQTTENGKKRDKLTLIWQVRFLTKDGKTGWNIHVNATTGDVVQTFDEVVHCSFGPGCAEHGAKDGGAGVATHALSSPPSAGYTVFDYPLEAPTFGSRTSVANPYTRFTPAGTGPGSTNGWHTDGITSYSITRGNNVWASEDTNTDNIPGNSPGSPTLNFDFPYTLGLNTAAANQNAAITNLFYWNNLIHNVLWRYGFDEPSGNFQQNNMDRGGQGNDFVYADAQDGSGTNNANFATPPDGSSPRMQMFLWNLPGTYQADSDFDNGIIAHEYGHGWSIRLTGGPANVSCLWNAEQGGEGWSDYLALMLTTNWATLTPTVASANLRRGIGTYALGQSTSGLGIRPYPYSYDMANVNGAVTYGKVGDSSFSQPHGIGSIWATMLWDMTWEIIMQDGQLVPNIYDTPGSVTAMRGNVAALKLVNEGLRLQPCSPSFVDARNAILQADLLLFNGRYRCAIGRAFARRGLGANASTGTSSNDRIVTEDFTPIGGNALTSPTLTTACSGVTFAYTAITPTTGVTFSWSRAVVSGISNASATGSSATVNETLINTTNVPITVRYFFTSTPDVCSATPVPQAVSVVVNPVVVPLIGSYSVTQGGTVPPGEGLKARALLSSSVSGVLNAGSGTYVRASGDNATTYVPGERVFYRSYTFVAPVSGPVTLEVISTSLTQGDNDTYLSLYETAFDPTNPASNFVRGDDDSGTGLLSRLTHPLTQGNTYVVVVATFYPNVTGTFILQSSVPMFEQGVTRSVDGLLLDTTTPYMRSVSGSVYNAGGSTYYAAYTFTAPQSGLTTFQTTAATLSDGTSDTHISLYQNAFNPASPATNFLFADDDSGGNLLSRIDYPVAQGTTYVLVVGTWAPLQTGTFTLQSSAPIFPPGGDIGWFSTPTGGSPLATGFVFNPVGVPNSGLTNTLTPGTRTYYVSKSSIATCRQAVTFTVVGLSFDSVTSGDWSTPATWNCNCVPDGSLPVRIMNAHTVTIPNAYTAQARQLQLIGTGKVIVEGTGRVNY